MPATAPAPRSLPVGEAEAGRRLDLFLAERLRLSRAQARRLLARGAVTVSGRPVAESAKGEPLAAGATVEVAPFTRPEDLRAIPEPEAELRVLARGPGWLAVGKPAGVPVHPLREDERGSVLSALIARHPEVHGVGEGGLRSGVVHRLDVDTSGALLFATREETWKRLRGAFAGHRVEKLYRAIVVGRLDREGSAAVGLVTARHRPARVRVVSESEGERARGVRVGELSWRPVEVLEGATLIEVRPRTGHLHQIRATFEHLGHPIAGDRTYGASDDPSDAPRHMLHAARVRFEQIEASSPDPADFAAVRDRLRGS